MMSIPVGDILAAAKDNVEVYEGEDILPITVAIADPATTTIGVTIQTDYPLTMIERRYGIPFGKLRTDPSRFIFDPDELHGCKWSIDVHQTVFEGNAMNEHFMRTGEREGHVALALSTGMGNLLQNFRTVAYIALGGKLSCVVGENINANRPYACLVQYEPEERSKPPSMGVELLLFTDVGSCFRVSKHDYASTPAGAISHVERGFESKIKWAVSGYPLVLAGKPVSLEMTAGAVGDYRHLWRLPKLSESLVAFLKQFSGLNPRQKDRIEFYFAFQQIGEDDFLVPVLHDVPVTFPIDLPLAEERLLTLCDVCNIPESQLRGSDSFDRDRNIVKLDLTHLRKDFVREGYTEKNAKEDVSARGEFYIDEEDRAVTVHLRPAIYPHHIVGVTEAGELVNTSIGGRSGSSGISIANAKQLCLRLGLTDAVIFDNGNDVVARLGGGAIICHKKNIRQARLTGALHFGYVLPPNAFGGRIDGFELAYGSYEVGQSSSVGRAESEPVVPADVLRE